MRWPILTLCGITAAVLIGIAHSAALAMGKTLNSYLACDEDLKLTPIDFADGYGPDGYSA